MISKSNIAICLVLVSAIAGGLAIAGPGGREVYPTRPTSRVAIVDEAEMISAEDYLKINSLIDTTLTETAVPIVVVTISRLSHYGAARMSIEGYAQNLFNSWGIGHKTVLVDGQEVPRNLGVLLLVSKGDRKARIELGADWAHEKDATCADIMQNHIIAAFKRGDFSTGIRSGVEALSAMIREKEIPTPPRPIWHYLLVVGAAGLAIFTAASMIRRGSSGWAWLLWGLIFSIIGFVIYQVMSSRRGGGGGFGGGSFGGGFSGGGGASGSW
ncbi:MAG: TPM domain-containing protein [Deltaproteobacteria bacterium]|nr:TPM domain-containing protein [Deltaproteobacteria bacterium]